MPGFLFKETRRHARMALSPTEDTCVVQILLAIPEMELHRLDDASLNDKHMQRQA